VAIDTMTPNRRASSTIAALDCHHG